MYFLNYITWLSQNPVQGCNDDCVSSVVAAGALLLFSLFQREPGGNRCPVQSALWKRLQLIINIFPTHTEQPPFAGVLCRKEVPCVSEFYCPSLYMLLEEIRGHYRNVQSFSLAFVQGKFMDITVDFILMAWIYYSVWRWMWENKYVFVYLTYAL